MKIKRYISSSVFRIPAVVVLTLIFSIGFNFLRFFLPQQPANDIQLSYTADQSFAKIHSSTGYKVFPSRKQLMADPEINRLNSLASNIKPEILTVFAIPSIYSSQIIDNTESSIEYQRNLPADPPSALMSRFCIFLI